MTTSSDLALHEQVLLLALHDEKGTMQTWLFAYAAAGSILVELIDRGKLAVEQAKGHAVLTVKDKTPTGQAILDEALQKIAAAAKPATVESWVATIAGTTGLHNRISEGLCERGILTRSEDRVLWVFSRKTYPTADAAPEKALVARLESELNGTDPLTPNAAVLLALGHETNILPHVFDSATLKTHRDRINDALRLDALEAGQKEVVQAALASIANVKNAAIAGAM